MYSFFAIYFQLYTIREYKCTPLLHTYFSKGRSRYSMPSCSRSTWSWRNRSLSPRPRIYDSSSFSSNTSVMLYILIINVDMLCIMAEICGVMIRMAPRAISMELNAMITR